ncbi:hypothetical protein [Komagataeibacter sp. NFXK3]
MFDIPSPDPLRMVRPYGCFLRKASKNAALLKKGGTQKLLSVFYQGFIFRLCRTMPCKAGEKARAMRYPAPTAHPPAGAQPGFQNSF